MAVSSSGRFVAVRLQPGQDLKSGLMDVVRNAGFNAAAVVTCVGSLTSATLRLASATAENRDQLLKVHGQTEIVSLVGTFGRSANGQVACHLHACLADAEGKTVGGHVVSDCFVFTTAEIVLVELSDLAFKREFDPRTGFEELNISRVEGRKLRSSL